MSATKNLFTIREERGSLRDRLSRMSPEEQSDYGEWLNDCRRDDEAERQINNNLKI